VWYLEGVVGRVNLLGEEGGGARNLLEDVILDTRDARGVEKQGNAGSGAESSGAEA
jgi:hypothetical protein